MAMVAYGSGATGTGPWKITKVTARWVTSEAYKQSNQRKRALIHWLNTKYGALLYNVWVYKMQPDEEDNWRQKTRKATHVWKYWTAFVQ